MIVNWKTAVEDFEEDTEIIRTDILKRFIEAAEKEIEKRENESES